MKTAFSLCLSAITLLATPALAYDIKTLSKASASWDGAPIHYPIGDEEVTAIQITLGPGEKLPFHCHPFPTLGYMTSGAIQVDRLNGDTKKFAKGDVIMEVVNTWHRGRNLSDKEPAELVVFYTGLKDKPNSIEFSETNKAACKE